MLTAECAHLYEEVGLLVENAKQRSRPISAMSSDWLDVVQWNRYLFDGLQHYHQAKLDEARHLPRSAPAMSFSHLLSPSLTFSHLL